MSSEAQRVIRVAVVGSGPSGFYAAAALLADKTSRFEVDVLDRLPSPYGLVRGGVAPDHQKIKSVVKAYEKTAADPRFRFFGNVRVGADVTHADLLGLYDQVVYAVGAESANRLGIPGEDLAGSHSATEFVGWYNGNPDHQHRRFDLSASGAAVVGVGNVSMDLSRLLACERAHLAPTDISPVALDQLAASGVRDVWILGRRGAAQAAFTTGELEEIADLPGVDLRVSAEEVALDPASEAWLQATNDLGARKNVAFLQARAAVPPNPDARVRVHLRLWVSPVAIEGDGRTERLVIERNAPEATPSGDVKARGTGERETLPVGLVFRAVGYRGIAVPGIPFDERRGIIPNAEGRVLADGHAPASAAGEAPAPPPYLPRTYVVGWAKRGPSGLIGTNRQDSKATVERMIEDAPALPASDLTAAAADAFFAARVRTLVRWDDWKRLDAHEVAEGAKLGKIRYKLPSVPEMLAVIDPAHGA